MQTIAGWMVFDWAMVLFTAILVIIRLQVRASVQRDDNKSDSTVTILPAQPRQRCCATLRLSDAFTVSAWVFLVLTIIPYQIIATVYPNELFSDNPAPPAVKLYFVSQMMNTNCLFSVKIAVTLTYREFLWQPKARWWLTVLQTFTAVAWVINLLTFAPLLRYSNHPEYLLSRPAIATACYVMYYALHIITDLLIYIFPIPTIILPFLRRDRLRLHNDVSTGKKVRVSASFLVGFLCIICATVNLLGAAGVISMDLGYVLDTVEQVWAIMVVCMPTTIGALTMCYHRARGGKRKDRRDRNKGKAVNMERMSTPSPLPPSPSSPARGFGSCNRN